MIFLNYFLVQIRVKQKCRHLYNEGWRHVVNANLIIRLCKYNTESDFVLEFVPTSLSAAAG